MPLGNYQNRSEELLGRAEDAYGSLGRGGSAVSGLGQRLSSQYGSTFAPLNRRIVAEAPINSNDLVDQAALDTNLSFDKARGIQERSLSRMGINPNSGRFQGLQQQLQLAQAAAEAGARTRARRAGRREGFGRMLSAAGLGQNLPGQAVNAMSAGASIGARAGEGLRGLAGDYGSLASSQAEEGELNSFQKELDALFGNKPSGPVQTGVQAGYNPGGFSTFRRSR